MLNNENERRMMKKRGGWKKNLLQEFKKYRLLKETKRGDDFTVHLFTIHSLANHCGLK
jgi:hypothetical protein